MSTRDSAILTEHGLAALDYLRRGLRPIPCHAPGDRGYKPEDAKKPRIAWKQYQNLPPTEDEVRTWWTQWPEANVAVVTGNGLLVVDLDGPHARALLASRGITLPADAPTVRTGKGEQVHLGCTEPRIGNAVRIINNGLPASDPAASAVDVRAAGGYAMMPPSVHPSGRRYEWVVALGDGAPPPVPPELLQLIMAPPTPPSAPGVVAVELGEPVRRAVRRPAVFAGYIRDGIPQGQRDETLHAMALQLLFRHVPREVVVEMLWHVAQRSNGTEPVPRRQVEEKVRSAEAYVREHADEEAADAALEIVSQWEALRRGRERIAAPPPVITTPYDQLNRHLGGGFRPSQLVYLGAPPGIGKTAFGTILGKHAAQLGFGVLIISLEMDLAEMATRMIAQHGRLSLNDLRAADGRGAGLPTLDAVTAALADLPIQWLEAAAPIEALVAALDGMRERPAMLVVDHVQHMICTRKLADRRLEMEYVSKQLLGIAKRHNTVVLGMSQVTGEYLKESRALEAHASVVMFLRREFAATETDLYITKSRAGSTGVVKLEFEGEFAHFAPKDGALVEPEFTRLPDRAASFEDPSRPTGAETDAQMQTAAEAGLAALLVADPDGPWSELSDLDVWPNREALAAVASSSHACAICARAERDLLGAWQVTFEYLRCERD